MGVLTFSHVYKAIDTHRSTPTDVHRHKYRHMVPSHVQNLKLTLTHNHVGTQIAQSHQHTLLYLFLLPTGRALAQVSLYPDGYTRINPSLSSLLIALR
jgi:hypothetical protein